MKRIPVIPTLIVLAAVAVMVRLGFWQLERMEQKEALLARYEEAQQKSSIVEIKDSGPGSTVFSKPGIAYRRATLDCSRRGDEQLVAGLNASGQAGWAHVFGCKVAHFEGFNQIAVVIGWSKDLNRVRWEGGTVEGTLVPGIKSSVSLPETRGTSFGFVHNVDFHFVADPPLAGLQPNARPDPRDIPNNHLSYAVQWLLFALTALVIYALALRKRLRG